MINGLMKESEINLIDQVRRVFLEDALRKKEAIILQQIIRYLGHDKFTMVDLVNRCHVDNIEHSEIEIFYIDKIALVEFYKAYFEQDAENLTANQKYRILLTDEQCV